MFELGGRDVATGVLLRGLGLLKEGTGEPAVLLLAWASLKAATEIRWDESDATLSPRGRGGGRGKGRLYWGSAA